LVILGLNNGLQLMTASAMNVVYPEGKGKR